MSQIEKRFCQDFQIYLGLWLIQGSTRYQLGQDKSFPPPNFSANTLDTTGACYPAALISPTCTVNSHVNVQANHAVVSQNISREAITLLKNANNTLPLSTSAALKLFGSDSANNPAGPNACNQRGCDTGVLGMGWGSGILYSVCLFCRIYQTNPSS